MQNHATRQVLRDLAEVVNNTDTRIQLTDLCHRLVALDRKYKGLEPQLLASVLGKVGVRAHLIRSFDAYGKAKFRLGVYPAALFKAVAR